MELNQDDLRYFVAYVLLDEARRNPSGKRQTQPMKGFWMSSQGKQREIRRSDARIRWCVCIEALRTVGKMSVEKAAAQVADMLGRSSAGEVAVIRVAYYECRLGRHQLYSFFTYFLEWRKWVLQADEETIRNTLADYVREFGQVRGARLATLFETVRSDPVQVKRNRHWQLEPGQEQRARIESNHWDRETEWQQLATDLWVLGRIHARVDDIDEAKALLKRALGLWSTYGAVLPDVQVQAIADLNDEIGRLGAHIESKHNQT